MLEFKKYNELEEKLNHQKKSTRIWSLIRAILAIASIIFIICLLFIVDYLLYGLLSGVFLALFFISVSLSNPSY
jgi:uncharacterized membrane protein